ncbi:unnamed protein product [Oppiella nova]|uniref:Uncharacterized protein n=1 Tax=Oppiella nova TaxID=334625 RepID=A0A7R9MVF2_9ACAR|nr:unnamed protein product [Oppiella nova]CAG2184301.1 unnamed protein product [Oppiella nova]
MSQKAETSYGPKPEVLSTTHTITTFKTMIGSSKQMTTHMLWSRICGTFYRHKTHPNQFTSAVNSNHTSNRGICPVERDMC